MYVPRVLAGVWKAFLRYTRVMHINERVKVKLKFVQLSAVWTIFGRDLFRRVFLCLIKCKHHPATVNFTTDHVISQPILFWNCFGDFTEEKNTQKNAIEIDISVYFSFIESQL